MRREQMEPPVLVHLTTVPGTLFFVAGQPAIMRQIGLSVHAISSPGADLDRFGEQEQVPVHPITMTRRISPLRDIGAVWRVWQAIERIRPVIVHGHTPKGGLLGMVAACLAGTPLRIYHMHGLPFATASGVRRQLLRLSERTSCALAHRVLAVSASVRDIAVAEGLCPPDKIRVLLSGSAGGVDVSRFRPLGVSVRLATRADHRIPPDALVIGFVGRFVRDKGIAELADAWGWLREREPRLRLLLVGSFEDEHPLPARLVARLRADPRVHFVGWQEDPSRFYAAMDVVALPTYREGLPYVPLEAAAMAIPVVATRVPGCVDAVQDGITGTLVAPGDGVALAEALYRYLSDPGLRASHGEAGRRRVLARFRREMVCDALADEYRELLAKRGTRLPSPGEARADRWVGDGVA